MKREPSLRDVIAQHKVIINLYRYILITDGHLDLVFHKGQNLLVLSTIQKSESSSSLNSSSDSNNTSEEEGVSSEPISSDMEDESSSEYFSSYDELP